MQKQIPRKWDAREKNEKISDKYRTYKHQINKT